MRHAVGLRRILFRWGAGVALLAGWLSVPLSVNPSVLFMTGALLCAVLVVVEHQWPREAQAAYARPWGTFLVVGGVMSVTLGVLADFYRVPFGPPGNVFGRTLPFGEADRYLTGVRSLFEFGQLTEWASHRPTPTVFLALFYGLAGRDLARFQLLIAFLVAIVSSACCVSLMRRWGLASATCFFVLLTASYAPIAGRFVSESGELLIGLCAALALMAGHEHRSLRLSAFGLALLAVAVGAGRNALCVIPFAAGALVLGHHSTWRKTGRNAMEVSAIVLATLALTVGAGELVVATHATSQGRIATVAEGFQSPVDITLNALLESWEKTVLDPVSVALGPASSSNLYVWFIPTLFAVWVLVFSSRRVEYPRLLAAVLLGVMLSAPFLAGGGSQVLVGTLPVLALLPTFGVALWAWPQRRLSISMAWPRWGAWLAATPGLLVVSLLVVAPLAFRVSGGAAVSRSQVPGEYWLKFEPGAFVYVTATQVSDSPPQNRSRSELQEDSTARQLGLADSLLVGSTIASALDLTRQEKSVSSSVWVVFPKNPGFATTTRARVLAHQLPTTGSFIGPVIVVDRVEQLF